MRKSCSNRSNARSAFFSVILALVLIFFSSDISVRPTITEIAKIQMKRELRLIIADAVKKSVSGYEGEIAEIKYSPTGKISSVAINPQALSDIQTAVTLSVNSRLEGGKTKVHIPVGTFSGLAILNGKGANASFDVISDKSVHTDVQSRFVSAGINQTLHEISITVNADAVAVIPLYSTDFSIEETYIICNTVIVGDIPESYTSVNGDDRGEISQLFDYSK